MTFRSLILGIPSRGRILLSVRKVAIDRLMGT